MNDEIKEILGYLQENSKKDEATKQLVDYITNLQHTEDLYNQLLKDYDELQARIEKAIEYLEKEKSNYMRSCDISNATNREGLIISSAVRTCDDTLKILRGNNER